MNARPLREPLERDSRLSDLGLSYAHLLEVVDACVAASANCTDNDPPTAKGFNTYSAGVRRLREVLCPMGWESSNTNNFCTVVNHELRLQIAVMNSDGGTCDSERTPSNKNPKGPKSEEVASRNQALLPGLEWPMERLDGSRPAGDDYVTWHLCINIDGDRINAELALLNGFEGRYFVDCAERIFLLKDAEWAGSGDRDEDLGPEFEVEVHRK